MLAIASATENPNTRAFASKLLFATLVAAHIGDSGYAQAEPWIAPGDIVVRDDLLTLTDAGVLNVPVNTWPLSWGDITNDLSTAQDSQLSIDALLALNDIRDRLRIETRTERFVHAAAGIAEHPRVIRTFGYTPRADAELNGALSWTGDRFAARLSVTRAWKPADGENIELDGTYLGVAVGNWMISVGYPERWWGPGVEGSLILSTNARPMPQIGINRNRSEPFDRKWLRWIGPWSATSFMARMDDDRVVTDALVFGARVSARPLKGLEIGLSRTAQWCGENRPCDLSAFGNLLLGKDNPGVNVGFDAQPGNQLAGIDLRWALPFTRGPDALYAQWIGEDTRHGGPQIGSWLRQVGMEFSGFSFSRWRQRTFLEISDTICREGGFGAGGKKFGCAYEHTVYQTGYRYRGRSVGHAIDGDGTIYSVGTSLTGNDGKSWRFTARSMRLNENSVTTNALTKTRQDLNEITVSHARSLSVGTLHAGVGYQQKSDDIDPEQDGHSFFAWVQFAVN